MAALLLLLAQRRELNTLVEEHREREQDRKRDQARFVSAWCKRVDPPKEPDVYGDPGHELHRVWVVYRNASEEPIFAASVSVKNHWGASPEHVSSRWLYTVPPGTSGEVFVDIDLRRPPSMVFGTDPSEDPPPPVEIQFRDARGRGWYRDDEGLLREFEVKADLPPVENY